MQHPLERPRKHEKDKLFAFLFFFAAMTLNGKGASNKSQSTIHISGIFLSVKVNN